MPQSILQHSIRHVVRALFFAFSPNAQKTTNKELFMLFDNVVAVVFLLLFFILGFHFGLGMGNKKLPKSWTIQLNAYVVIVEPFIDLPFPLSFFLSFSIHFGCLKVKLARGRMGEEGQPCGAEKTHRDLSRHRFITKWQFHNFNAFPCPMFAYSL